MGDGYEVLVSREVQELPPDVQELLEALDEKSGRIVRGTLEKLVEPHPGGDKGEEGWITWRGQVVYRLHVGRTWTAFYDVDENDLVVQVLRVMPTDDAHEEYGSLGSAESRNVRIANHTNAERHRSVSRSTRCARDS